MWGNPTLLNRENIITNWLRKVNIDTINWKELFDRSTDHKQCNIPWLVKFKESFCETSSQRDTILAKIKSELIKTDLLYELTYGINLSKVLFKF